MIERATTPPSLQGPTAKEKKYDRQLRLWAASGQQALEEAHVLLLSSGPGVVGAETLKNLILPGVGNFTIVDDAVVSEKDLGVNFFLEEDSLGKSRAEETCRLLRELNPEVHGKAISKSVEAFVESINTLNKYSLILLIGPTKHCEGLERISQHAQKSSIPLFYIHCVGFYSHFSVQLPALFPIVDTHPDPASTQDLRLLNAWPELLALVQDKTQKLDSVEDHQHGHVPYLLLLLHYLDIWKTSHEGKAPTNYPEKKEFKVLIERGARRNNAEGGEENFDEAAAAVLKSLNPPSIPSGLREVFDAEECKTLASESGNFWIISNAIQAFHSAHNVLPLPGALPDMKAQSADYIQLQNIYKSKARKDFAEVTGAVRASEKLLRRTSAIEEKEIEAFCKGAAFVKLIKGRPIKAASSDPTDLDWSDRAKRLSQELQDPMSLIPVYFAFLAYDHFQDRRKDGYENDMPFMELTQTYIDEINYCLENALKSTGFDVSIPRESIGRVLKELDRADGAELHNVAALTGGMVAQEVIKIITKQYVPIDNTCVFDGIESKTAVFNI